jgi:hypothetical protein
MFEKKTGYVKIIVKTMYETNTKKFGRLIDKNLLSFKYFLKYDLGGLKSLISVASITLTFIVFVHV